MPGRWPFRRARTVPEPTWVNTVVHRRTDIALWKSTFLLQSYSPQDRPNSLITLVDGYVERLPESVADDELGVAVRRVLEHEVGTLTRPNYRATPRPRLPSDDLMDELGVTERVFEKTGSHGVVYRDDDKIRVVPFFYEKSYLGPSDDVEDVVLPTTVDPTTLGRAVRAALTRTAPPARRSRASTATTTGSVDSEPSSAAEEAPLPREDPVALAASLRASGLWAGLPTAEQDVHERAVAAGGYPLNEGVPCYVADGEDLSEGGVLELLAELAPALTTHGLELDAHDVVEADQTYTISINGVRCTVLPDADEPDWYGATMRPLGLVNELLGQVGATVRVFVSCPGGNEGIAVLTDPRVPAAMRASGLFDERDLPVLAVRAD